jgi:hypothetical protein
MSIPRAAEGKRPTAEAGKNFVPWIRKKLRDHEKSRHRRGLDGVVSGY